MWSHKLGFQLERFVEVAVHYQPRVSGDKIVNLNPAKAFPKTKQCEPRQNLCNALIFVGRTLSHALEERGLIEDITICS